MITGITGQDGQYLGRFLLGKGYDVIGLSRDRRAAERKLKAEPACCSSLQDCSLGDQQRFRQLLSSYEPDEIYNLAGFSTGTGMFDDPVSIGRVNGLAVAEMLDSVRHSGRPIRFLQASSREVFGDSQNAPQHEGSLRKPRNPYGAAKQYADEMVRIYREHYGVFSASAILFNHESPLRGVDFVTRKVSLAAAKIKLGLQTTLSLGDLSARRDWGFAGDYVKAMWLILQQDDAQDFVIASGATHAVRDLCELAFAHLGLDYRDYVEVASQSLRPTETVGLLGDARKARELLGWTPEHDFSSLVAMMVDADFERERKGLEMSVTK